MQSQQNTTKITNRIPHTFLSQKMQSLRRHIIIQNINQKEGKKSTLILHRMFKHTQSNRDVIPQFAPPFHSNSHSNNYSNRKWNCIHCVQYNITPKTVSTIIIASIYFHGFALLWIDSVIHLQTLQTTKTNSNSNSILKTTSLQRQIRIWKSRIYFQMTQNVQYYIRG